MLDFSQTSGNDWTETPAAMLYHGFQETAQNYVPRVQLATFVDLEQQMARFEADHEALIVEIGRHYVMPAKSPVLDVFRSYRTIPQLLIEAVPRLWESFGIDAVFNLRVLIDESGSRTLYAVAMWAGSAKDVSIALDQFEDGWWILNSRQASGILTFTYELV
jgi:hypothetical protein